MNEVNFYTNEEIETRFDEDSISSAEYGFMQGYLDS